MIITFGQTLDSSCINDAFYRQWDAVTQTIRDNALNEPLLQIVFGQRIYSVFNHLVGKNRSKEHANLWQTLFAHHIQNKISTNMSTECIISKLMISKNEDGNNE